MIDIEQLRTDIRDFNVDVEALAIALEEIVSVYDAERAELQNWRRRKSYSMEVQSIVERLKVTRDRWSKLPSDVRNKIENFNAGSVDATLDSLIEEMEYFAEIHRETKGNPGLASDNGAIEIGPLERLIMELATLWPEPRFDHRAIISRRDRIAEPKGRFLRFVDAITRNALDPQPSVPTLSALIRKIKPKLSKQQSIE